MPVVSLARVVRSADSFRPEGSEDLELWTMIDLRPPGSREGICLLGSSEAPAGAITLTDDPSKDSITSRRLLQNGVGVNVAGKHLGRQILGLMLDGKKDGSRWRPLMPSRHAWEVWLGNECIDRVPVVAGGAVSVFDDYNRANGALGGGWGTTGGSQTISANRHRVGGTGGAVHGTALNSSDMQASATIVAETNPPLAGTLVRVPISTYNEGYWGYARMDASDQQVIMRLSGSVVGGGGSHAATLARNNDFTPIPATITTRAVGSTITFYEDGGLQLSATDTVIPGNFGHGVRGFQLGAVFFDNYLAETFGPTGWRIGAVAL